MSQLPFLLFIHPNATAQTIINTFKKISGILISVRTLLIRLIILLLMLWSLPPGCWPPKEGSEAEELPQPMRARKRSSERTAMALTRRMDTEGWG